jgi:hypothetical protein
MSTPFFPFLLSFHLLRIAVDHSPPPPNRKTEGAASQWIPPMVLILIESQATRSFDHIKLRRKGYILSAPLPPIEPHRTLRRSPYDNNLLDTCSHSLFLPCLPLSSFCSISPTPSMSTCSDLCTSFSLVIFHMHKINATATAIATKLPTSPTHTTVPQPLEGRYQFLYKIGIRPHCVYVEPYSA